MPIGIGQKVRAITTLTSGRRLIRTVDLTLIRGAHRETLGKRLIGASCTRAKSGEEFQALPGTATSERCNFERCLISPGSDDAPCPPSPPRLIPPAHGADARGRTATAARLVPRRGPLGLPE